MDHPHVHGSSSLQVGGGAASALIVMDPPGYLPEIIESAQDVLLFVQHMDIEYLEEIAIHNGDEMLNIQALQPKADFRLVNGQYQPTIHLKPNEWQRWRIVYGSWLRDPLDFTFAGHDNTCEITCERWDIHSRFSSTNHYCTNSDCW